jgi:MFS family permease
MQLGRKRTILLGNLFICIGAVLQASAFSVPHILVGRIVTGAGIGCIASTVPTYMAEMSLEANERGPEVSYQLALLISGVALAYWLDLGFVQGLKAHPWLWRVPLAMQSCFAIFSTCLLAFLPDTPRWYYARGRYDEADRCLARLYSLPVESEVVQQTREEVLNSLKDEENDSASFNWWLLFWDNSELQFGRRLRTSFLILWAQQFRKFTPQNPHVVCFDMSLTHRSKVGINMLVYFSTQIFSNLGYSPMLSGILAGVMNTIFAIASYPPIWFIEKLGRRAMMFWCALGCGVCMLIYVGLTTVANPTTATNWAAVVFIILYNVVFAFGWLGTCWIYGKLSLTRHRHSAISED